MAKTKQEIKSDIKEYVAKCGKGSYGWYIGIAADAKKRLFNDHAVDEENGAWIYSQATSSTTAREIEVELIKELGAKGDQGGGSDDTTYVYAYQITSSTKE